MSNTTLIYDRATTCNITYYKPEPIYVLNNELQKKINSIINDNNNNDDVNNNILAIEHHVLDIVDKHKKGMENKNKLVEHKQIEQQQETTTEDENKNNDNNNNNNDEIKTSSHDNNIQQQSITALNMPIGNDDTQNIDIYGTNNTDVEQEHNNMIEQFIELTGITDIDGIRNYLLLLDYDLDRSVTLYYNDEQPSLDNAIDKAKALKNK